MERPDFDPSNAPVYQLVQEVLRLRADIAIIAANVVQQAIERDWCGEYDQWARITNKQCSRPHMIQRNDWEEDASAPAVNGSLPEHEANPVYREPTTGLPALDGCQCPLCVSARAERFDPSLDESGRFNV